jgi:hypothetical protein
MPALQTSARQAKSLSSAQSAISFSGGAQGLKGLLLKTKKWKFNQEEAEIHHQNGVL